VDHCRCQGDPPSGDYRRLGARVRARPVFRGLRHGDAPELPDWKPFHYGLECPERDARQRQARKEPPRPQDRYLRCSTACRARRARSRAGVVRPALADSPAPGPDPATNPVDWAALPGNPAAREADRVDRNHIHLDHHPVPGRIRCQSGRLLLEALIAGECNPASRADLAKGRLRVKTGQPRAAYEGGFTTHHGNLSRLHLDRIDLLNARIHTLTELRPAST